MQRVARVAITAATACMLLASGTVIADSNTASGTNKASDSNAPETILNPQQLAKDTQAQAVVPTSQQTQSSQKLSANTLKICQKRQSKINILIQRINSRARNQLALFTTIAARVETFYGSKSKPLTGYSKLEAAVATKETQTQDEQSGLALIFNCSGNSPITTAQSYLQSVQQEVSDLESYRAAVMKLILAVANVNGVKIETSGVSI